MSRKLRYSEFVDRINVRELLEEVGWSWEYEDGKGNLVGFCMFPENHSHGDTTGKFAVHEEGRVYNCWACGGGDLADLVMRKLGYDHEQAVAFLAEFTEEDTRDDHAFTADFLDAFRDVEQRVETLPYFNEHVLDQFEWGQTGTVPLGLAEWMTDRAISVETLSKYKVGYSNTIQRRSPPRGKFAEDEDYTGPGIVLPHYWKGRLVGWQTRWLEEDRPDWVPKYTNTSDFPKETTIYGADHVDGSQPVAVVESVPSCLFVVSAGLDCVATFGSSINPAQMRILRRYRRLVLLPDGDAAGAKWARDLREGLRSYSEVYTAEPLGEGLDVGDLGGMDDSFMAAYAVLEEYVNETLERGEIPL